MIFQDRKIRLSCFVTKGNPFLNLSIPHLTLFKFKHEVYGSYVYRRFLRDLERRGVAAVPRRNKLYFSGRKDLLLEAIQSHDLPKRIGLEYEDKHGYISINLSDPTDVEILRMIIYSLIRQLIMSSANKEIRFFGSGLNVLVREAPEGNQREVLEGIIRRIRSNVDTFLEDIKIYYGLVFRLEISKDGRGRLWFDLITKPLRVGGEITKREWLSREELRRLDTSLSKLYRELAQPPSYERLNKKIGLLEELGLKHGFTVMILDHEGRSLKKVRFIPLF